MLIYSLQPCFYQHLYTFLLVTKYPFYLNMQICFVIFKRHSLRWQKMGAAVLLSLENSFCCAILWSWPHLFVLLHVDVRQLCLNAQTEVVEGLLRHSQGCVYAHPEPRHAVIQNTGWTSGLILLALYPIKVAQLISETVWSGFSSCDHSLWLL